MSVLQDRDKQFQLFKQFELFLAAQATQPAPAPDIPNTPPSPINPLPITPPASIERSKEYGLYHQERSKKYRRSTMTDADRENKDKNGKPMKKKLNQTPERKSVCGFLKFRTEMIISGRVLNISDLSPMDNFAIKQLANSLMQKFPEAQFTVVEAISGTHTHTHTHTHIHTYTHTHTHTLALAH
jgi:hypothetical protein